MKSLTSVHPNLPLNNVWRDILAWENLFLAYRKARRGKRHQAEIQDFTFDLEYELTAIRQDLITHTYKPGGFRQFHVRDRKLRLISAAPFRDRVVQHALMNIVEPELDKAFIRETFASRKHKGVHAAVNLYRRWANRYAYALKMDIRRYFDSIDHQLVKQKLVNFIADTDVLWLFDTIIDSSPLPLNSCVVIAADDDLVDLACREVGLPLGNLTSQFLGNLYLNDLDHYVKDKLKIPAYLRYVDDMILLADCKDQLWDWCDAIEQFLARERIGIHPRKKTLVPVSAGLDVLGYRVFPDSTRLSRGSGYKFRRKLRSLAKAYSEERMTLQDIKPHVAGWLGHARQADTRGLCKAVLSEVSFVKGGTVKRSPGGSGRFVEQQSTEPPVG
jgi:retron-type reverse transcriptase